MGKPPFANTTKGERSSAPEKRFDSVATTSFNQAAFDPKVVDCYGVVAVITEPFKEFTDMPRRKRWPSSEERAT